MQTVFSFFNLSAFLFLAGSHFRIDRLGGRDIVPNEGKVDIDSLCGLDTSLSVTLMDHDLVDQLIQHGWSQVFEILILIDQCHELLCFAGTIGVTFD